MFQNFNRRTIRKLGLVSIILFTIRILFSISISKPKHVAVRTFDLTKPLEPIALYDSISCLGNKMPQFNVSAIICYHDVEDHVSETIKKGEVYEPEILSKYILFRTKHTFSICQLNLKN